MRRLSKRQRIATSVLAVVALCFITLDVAGGSLAPAHSGVRGSLGALYRGTDGLLGPVRRFLQGVPTAGTNKSRIDHLEQQNAQLRKQLAQRSENAATARELSRLRLAADSLGARVLPARVTAFAPGEGFDWTVTVDAGTSSGVRAGQTVTDGVGLVGRVLHADGSSAVIVLSVDPHAGVGVRDTRTGQLGVATGAGTSGFTFTPLDPNANVRVGDVLMTGPAGSSSYVAGVEVGTVRSVRVSADGSTRAAVDAATSPTALDVVGIVLTGATATASGRAPLQPGGAH